MLWVPQESAFISTQFFILNLGGRFGVLSKFSFYFLVFHYYITTSSTILSFFFWRCVSFFRYFFSMLINFCFICNCLWTILWWDSEVFGNFISNFLANQITTSAVFGIFLFVAVLCATLVDYLAWWRLRLYLLFSPIFLLIFLAKVKHPLSILFLCLIE